ncbi:MAG: hypothetical protein RR595_09780 [Lysinibacillus sp.]
MNEHKDVLASMGIDLDTKRFELKLRAIAKHAEALADELDRIGNDNYDPCPKCGGHSTEVDTIYSGTDAVETYLCCHDCVETFDYELPTRLEGSD